MINDTAPTPPDASESLSSRNVAASGAEDNQEVHRESEAELRLILQSIAGMICVVSPRGELISSNQQLLDYFKQPLEEVGRWATNGTTHPDDIKQTVETFTASLTSGEPYDFETRFRRFDGAFRWFQIRGHPLRDADGEILRWYGLLTDIDDRKRAEETLRASEIDLRLTLNSIPGIRMPLTQWQECKIANALSRSRRKRMVRTRLS
jgi:PAS domain S-box-containing protein